MGQSAKQSTDDFKDVQCTVYSVQCTKIGTVQKKFCAYTFFKCINYTIDNVIIVNL